MEQSTGYGHHPGHPRGWTEERVADLKKRFAEGETATQIAKAMGGGLTRNGVIGKAHRLGLTSASRARAMQGRTRPDDVTLPKREPKAPKVKPIPNAHHGRPPGPSKEFRAAVNAPAPLSEPKAPYVPKPDQVPGALNVTLFDLMKGQCRWPVGDARPQLFCGKPHDGESPYCVGHHASSRSSHAHTARLSGKELTRSLRQFL